MEHSPSKLPVPFEREVHLLDYLYVVQRRWRIALIVFLAIFLGEMVWTLVQTPIYQAGVTLRVGGKPEPSQQIIDVQRDIFFSIDSEIRVLLSQVVAERAAGHLQRSWRPKTREHHRQLSIDELEVSPTVRSLHLEQTGEESFRLIDQEKKVLAAGESDQPFFGDGIRGLITLNDGKTGVVIELVRMKGEVAAEVVATGVSAAEIGKQTNLLQLTVQNPDPYLARDAANAIALAYLEQSRSAKAQEATMTLGFIDGQLQALGRDLDTSEQSLQEFKIRTGLERLSPEGASLVDAAVGLEKQRADLSVRRQRIAAFIAAIGSGLADFSAVQELPGIQQDVNRMLELRARRNDLLRSYTPAHPAVIELDESLRQLEGKIAGAARLALRNLDQQIGQVSQALGQNTARLQQVPEEELELVRLSRASKVNAELYSYLLQRQQEMRIRQAATTSDVEIIDRAGASEEPVKPNKKKNLALGLVLGLMCGIGLAFLLDYLDRTIKDEDDVQERLGLPVLGNIPKIDEAGEGPARRLVARIDPLSSACEAFLALRTNLLYIVTNQKHKTILVTSCLPDEGKSTVAANLAATLADTGVKTLLIDCDLRRPSLHRFFDQEDVPGLSDLLAGTESVAGAIRRLRTVNLDFIPDGTEPPNPTQLLNSRRMRDFLAKAHERYDYVVLDVPPLVPVTDALILASQVDLNILVIESCRIPEKLVARALKSLHSHGAAPAGVVLNDKSGKGARYYGAYNYYESKYYQGYYRRNEPVPQPPRWRRVLDRAWEFING